MGCPSARARWRAIEEAAERLLGGRSGETSDEALLALLLGQDAVGSLSTLGGLRDLLSATPRELTLLPGLGDAGAARLLAALEIGRRASSAVRDHGAIIRSSCDVHAFVGHRMTQLPREVVVALALDARGRVVGEHRISEGGLDGCAVSPRDFFAPLLRDRAASCILVHNHPSGDPEPSADDRALTARMSDAGRILGLRLLDHVIVAACGWFSFRDAGLV